MNQSEKIVASWEANADAWTATVANNELESRRLATNEAIVSAVLSTAPRRILDLGCGEGWLSRALRTHVPEVYGADAIEALVQASIQQDGPYYFCYSYRDIYEDRHQLPAPFDTVVINFALLDDEDTERLINSLPSMLSQNGYLVVQTLHSSALKEEGVTTSGWKEGSWNGMKRSFVLPYQWYFRTLDDWKKLFYGAEFSLREIREPLHPQTGAPLSFIFILQANTSSA